MTDHRSHSSTASDHGAHPTRPTHHFRTRCAPSGRSVSGTDFIERLKKRVGQPFRLGEPAQCANFVRDAFEKEGMTLPVTARPSDLALLPAGTGTGPGLADSLAGDEIGRRIARDGLMPGDLVFFTGTYGDFRFGVITHVGIYVGHGLMIHRPTMSGPISCDHLSRSAGHFVEGRRPGVFLAEEEIDRTVIDFRGGVPSGKLRNQPTTTLTLALTAENQIFVNNQPVTPKYVTVEMATAGAWQKAYFHDGRWSVAGMRNCKAQLQGGTLQVTVDGIAVKPSSCRFEVVTA